MQTFQSSALHNFLAGRGNEILDLELQWPVQHYCAFALLGGSGAPWAGYVHAALARRTV